MPAYPMTEGTSRALAIKALSQFFLVCLGFSIPFYSLFTFFTTLYPLLNTFTFDSVKFHHVRRQPKSELVNERRIRNGEIGTVSITGDSGLGFCFNALARRRFLSVFRGEQFYSLTTLL
jgi:hypothetical protein